MIPGLAQLADMRRSGRKPLVVSVETDVSRLRYCTRWHVEFDQQPRLLVGPGDNLLRIDFRFCHGCTCLVAGSDEARVIAICEALAEAGARPVLGRVEVGVAAEIVFTTFPVEETA